jgi:hypothetical protein
LYYKVDVARGFVSPRVLKVIFSLSRAPCVIIIIATTISVGKSNFQCGIANFICDDLMLGLIDDGEETHL